MRSLIRVTGGLAPAVAAVCLLGLLSGSAPGFHPGTVPEPPADPGTLVLQLREWRSMTAPYERAEPPEFTLYGGGRVIAGGHWEGSVYQAREYVLAPDRYRQIYRLAHAAGLAQARHFDEPVPATDGSLLVASLRSAGRSHTTTMVSPSERDTGARRRIVEFRRTVRVLALPADRTHGAGYRPTRLAVLATGGWGAPGDTSRSRPWPGPDLLAGLRTRVGLCTLLDPAGPDAETAALVRAAPLATRWRSGGQLLSVAIRPLLPDEYDCVDLDRRTP
ncbi:hypothetical protein AAH979_33290 [Plantactinospora sp. ZYX-F-223]|uniref:hypothetical protein n=1 Tax=Plantactinospora sp. ZYX-F-223 TaxID=3144103 RepID=UPI0031FBB44B